MSPSPESRTAKTIQAGREGVLGGNSIIPGKIK